LRGCIGTAPAHLGMACALGNAAGIRGAGRSQLT